MKRSLLLSALLSVLGPLGQAASPMRILAGAPPVPVVSGEVWLIANRWGAYPGVLVGMVHEGEFKARHNIQFPQYWEQAFDYKLLLAESNRSVEMPGSLVEDYAYGTGGRPDYLKGFPAVYLSAPLAAKGLGRNWEEALRQMGKFTNNTLILPPATRRTVRLLYPDGKPLAGADLDVSLYGSSENHCGVSVGIDLGFFTTDAQGEISLVATPSPLALGKRYFTQEASGPAGTAFTLNTDLIVNSAPAITVKRLWTLPKFDYILLLRTAENRPIAHARLTGCENFDGCQTGCGLLLGAPESDDSGAIRFRYRDLREMQSLTVASAQGQKRDLTESEMRELLTEHRVRLIWNDK